MKKRILAVLLTLCMVLSPLPVGVLANDAPTKGICGEDLTWTLEDGILTISGTGAMDDYGFTGWLKRPTWEEHKNSIRTVVINSGVTTIGSSSFYDYEALTSVVLSDSITDIGEDAFCACSGLTNITIPNSVTAIGKTAFFACEDLTNVTIPDSVTEIGEAAFFGCSSLVRITIPKSLTTIRRWAFFECDGLTCVTISEGVTSIESPAFYGCNSLNSVTIPNSVTSIEGGAFAGCSSLTDICVSPGNACLCAEDGVLFDVGKTKLIAYPGGKYGTYSIPNGVTAIDASAFEGCTGLTSVAIPDDITAIGVWAFNDCSSLTDVYYEGSKEDWAKIDIDYDNDELINAAFHYNAEMPKPPTTPDKPTPPAITFVDVPAGEYYADAVRWAVSGRITTGTTETTFSPDEPCTRAQAVTFLWRAAGQPEPANSSAPFTDVATDQYYYKAVLWTVEKGITNGVSATEFGPDITCNRAQIVTFLHRYEGEPGASGNGFDDVPAGEYYYAPVIWAVSKGVTNGVSATEFGPGNNCTRGQIVTFLYRDMVG